MAKAKLIKCPECQDEFELEDYLEIGDTTYCPSCDTQLKITRLEPPQVAIAEETLEDEDLEEGQDDEEF
jgi:uncharacterized paraquat-inducible protein A